MSELVLEILENFLGTPKKHYKDKHQISFDCPVCSYDIKGLDKGDGKGNLEINYEQNIYKCWACSETNDTHGSLYKLIKSYGNKDLLKKYKLVTPDIIHLNNSDEPKKTLNGLPKEFKPLTIQSNNIVYKKAVEYLKDRNIGFDLIHKFNIGYCDDGDYYGRVVFPSYDSTNNVNYFLGRSYDKKTKLKYKNPDVSKTEIIFNEGLLNYDSNIYIVEGVFDHIVVPNSVPMLGKVMSDNLFMNLVKYAECKVVLVLDSDAYNDAKKLYKRLNSTKLVGRVYIVKLPDGYDISDVNKLLGKKGVLNLLSTASKIKESDL